MERRLVSRLLLTAGLALLWRPESTLAWAPPSSSSVSFTKTTAISSSQQVQKQPRSSSSSELRSALEDTFTDVVAEESQVAAAREDGAGLLPEYQAAFGMIQAQLEAQIPEPYQAKMTPLLEHFALEYMTACQHSMLSYSTVNDVANDKLATEMVELCQPQVAAKRFVACLQYGLTFGMGPNKYKFDVYHKALRGDEQDKKSVDFMKFGNDFFRPCMDLKNSVLLGQENVDQLVDQLKQGHNVIFFANHQSEADPQVISCLTDTLTKHGKEFEKMIFVAGHKVTTDPLAVPFSMGRNLICIHSKKHINADAETKPEKQKQNLRAMSALTDRLKQGGTLLWLAPSGGRDRRNVETGEVPIAPFDRKTIDMFRLISNKAKNVPTHFYTMALVSYELCPPPDTVEAVVGEARNIRFVPCGISVGNECESTGGLESRDEFCHRVFEQCLADYETLSVAVNNNGGMTADGGAAK
ncbi:hypothetical protein ACA910_009456 [Epithemia clementina (nom. ined.)]